MLKRDWGKLPSCMRVGEERWIKGTCIKFVELHVIVPFDLLRRFL